MVTIYFNSPGIYYSGRWVTDLNTIGSGWVGSQIRFKVQGTNSINVTITVLDNSTTDSLSVVAFVDGSFLTTLPVTTAAEVYQGDKTVTLSLPNSSAHTVILKLSSAPIAQFQRSAYVKLKSVSIEDGANLDRWGDRAPYRIQTIGDSWMAVGNDWTVYLGVNDFNIYPVSFGGAKASDMDSMYNFVYSGTLVSEEPVMDAVLIGLAVNDQFAGVSPSAYKVSMSSLIDKVRAKQPSALIIIGGAPRNIGANRPFNQYDQVNMELSQDKANTVFIPVPNSFADTLVWESDQAHLTPQSRVNYAEWWRIKLKERLPEVYSSKLQIKLQNEIIEYSLYPLSLGTIKPSVLIKTQEDVYKLKLSKVASVTRNDVLIKTNEGLFKLQ